MYVCVCVCVCLVIKSNLSLPHIAPKKQISQQFGNFTKSGSTSPELQSTVTTSIPGYMDQAGQMSASDTSSITAVTVKLTKKNKAKGGTAGTKTKGGTGRTKKNKGGTGRRPGAKKRACVCACFYFCFFVWPTRLLVVVQQRREG